MRIIKKLKSLYQKLIRGYSDQDLKLLDVTIAKFILPRIKALRKDTNTYPSYLTDISVWIEELDLMIAAFEIIAESDNYFNWSTKEEYYEQNNAISKGLNSFAEHYTNIYK